MCVCTYALACLNVHKNYVEVCARGCIHCWRPIPIFANRSRIVRQLEINPMFYIHVHIHIGCDTYGLRQDFLIYGQTHLRSNPLLLCSILLQMITVQILAWPYFFLSRGEGLPPARWPPSFRVFVHSLGGPCDK